MAAGKAGTRFTGPRISSGMPELGVSGCHRAHQSRDSDVIRSDQQSQQQLHHGWRNSGRASERTTPAFLGDLSHPNSGAFRREMQRLAASRRRRWRSAVQHGGVGPYRRPMIPHSTMIVRHWLGPWHTTSDRNLRHVRAWRSARCASDDSALPPGAAIIGRAVTDLVQQHLASGASPRAAADAGGLVPGVASNRNRRPMIGAHRAAHRETGPAAEYPIACT